MMCVFTPPIHPVHMITIGCLQEKNQWQRALIGIHSGCGQLFSANESTR